MPGLVSRLYRGETRIDFIGSRKRWYAASALLILICAVSFGVRGFNYSIDFKGGTQYTISTQGTSNLTPGKVDDAFKAAGETTQSPSITAGSGSNKKIVATFGNLPQSTQSTLQTKVEKSLNIPAKNFSIDSVSSDWGHETTVNALKGLIIFLVLVCIYISIRFQWRMAVGGIVALAHDLIIAAGIYSIVGFEVSPSTIVGLLTILGFSLYDTVVVYDKVNENAKDILAGSKTTYAEAANLAVNQTLMRSINTSLIGLLPVAGLLFVGAGILGVGTIKDLALILFVGLASGAYSSLFLATPVVVELTERDPRYKQLAKRVAQKRASEARKAEDGELAGVAPTPNRRASGPAPAPKVGARPQRPNRPNTNRPNTNKRK